MANRFQTLRFHWGLTATTLFVTLGAVNGATVTIINGDPAGVGFNDATAAAPIGGNSGTTIGAQRLNVFQAVAAKWGATLTSSVNIRVNAIWTALTCSANSAVLGSAGAASIYRDFTNAPVGGHWFPKALADKLAGFDLSSANVDINANFNVNLGQSGCLTNIPFYLGLDYPSLPSQTKGQFVDLFGVVLHEFGHGLGFATFTNGSTGAMLSGFPSVWDDFLLDNTTNKRWTDMTAAERIASANAVNHLVWTGPSTNYFLPQVLTASGSSFSGTDSMNRPLLYTPSAYAAGSSVSHWDTSLTPNQIMEPFINPTLQHEVAPNFDLTYPLLEDIGWDSVPVPKLTVTSSHTGNFSQGQTGATYSITVANGGTLASSGAINISDTLPAGLTATNIAGAGWTCTLGTLTCSRGDVLAIGSSFPAVNVTVNVAADAASPLLNSASVWGGRSVAATATDTTLVLSGSSPDLTISSSHAGNFVRGQTGAVFTITVTNAGTATTSGTVTVTETAPTGLTATAIAGIGWTCTQPSGSCTRSTALGASSSYPAITFTVNVASNAPASVTDTVAVSGGGETNTSNDSASDIAIVNTSGTSPGSAEVGIFRAGYFWLEDVDGNQQFNTPADRAFAFGGIAGDIPITGDWNGNGTSKVGIYRPSNGLFILDSNGDGAFDAGDAVYNLGVGTQAGDVPVVGDWNGSGTTKVGLFRQGFFWILDTNGNGIFEQALDHTYAFGGIAGDVPVVGDWNGSGTSKIGLFRQGFYWILDANGNGTLDNVNGNGGDLGFAYGGIPGDVPVVGDWNGSGSSKVGVFRQGFFWVLDANGNHSFDGTAPGQDVAIPFGGITGDKPVVGKW